MMSNIKWFTGLFVFLFVANISVAVEHSPPATISQGQRAVISIKVDNPQGLKVARVYFKGGLDQKYNFVVLNHQGGGVFTAELPAPGANLKEIDYRIVTQSADGSVYKSPLHTIDVAAGGASAAGAAAAAAVAGGFISVYSELPQDLSSNSSSFDDNLKVTYNASRVSTSAGDLALAEGGSGVVGGSAKTGAAVAGGGGMSTGTQIALGATAIGVGGVAASNASSGDSKSAAPKGPAAGEGEQSGGSTSIINDLTGVPCGSSNYFIKIEFNCSGGSGVCPPFAVGYMGPQANMYYGFVDVRDGVEHAVCYQDVDATPVNVMPVDLASPISGHFGHSALCSNQVGQVPEYVSGNFEIVSSSLCAADNVPVVNGGN